MTGVAIGLMATAAAYGAYSSYQQGKETAANIKAQSKLPVLLTGGVKKVKDAEQLLADGKADLIGVGRAIMKDAHWRTNA